MLVTLIALGLAVSSLVALFVAVSLIGAILRLASKSNEDGVLRKDRSVQDEQVTNGGRAPSIFDGEDMIGGSPLHLPQPIGPTGTSFNFHVYAPPSVDNEIPKVDLVGTLDFVTTGKVRKFVPTIGAKRLLLVNLEAMALEVYLPKPGRKCKKRKGKGNPNANHVINNNKHADSGTLASFSDDTSKRSNFLKFSTGINISTKKVDIVEDEEFTDDEFEADDDDEVWSPRHFEATPKAVLKLNNLISVSALSPNRCGGLIEVLSCSPNDESKLKSVSVGKEKEVTTAGNLTHTMEETEPPPQKSSKYRRRPSFQLSETREDPLLDGNEMEEWWRGPNATHVIRNGTLTSFVESAKKEGNTIGAELFEETIIVGAGIDETTDADEIDTAPTEVCRNEFVFRTPRDAAEFQRIVMALRTSGKDIQQLYEALESIQANSDAHFPTTEVLSDEKRLTKGNTAKKVPRFLSPGVALDDAWRCLNEVAVVNAGLSQYRLYSLMKSDKYDDIIAAAASDDKIEDGTTDENGSSNEGNGGEEMQKKKELHEHYRQRRALLGIRDFFSLFVPPLPLDSPAVPHFSPCVASESSMERDSRFSGVEIHQLRLRLASALQLRVGSAAVYVRAYARAKAVVQKGWELDLIDQEPSSLGEGTPDDNEGKSDKESKEDHARISQKMTRLAYDSERENVIRDVGVQNECYEPSACPSQGYQLVGWHRFAIPSTNEREQYWLRPDKDPIETIPSLKEIVTRHSNLHFIVVSIHNDQINMATYFLLVRSLPIGVDESFDDSMNNFINGSAKERDKRFGLLLSVAPGHSWSSLAKVAIQFVTVALFGGKMVNTLGAERNSRISLPGVLFSNVCQLHHFGGSLRENGSLSNYLAINAHLTLTTGLLLRRITVETCSVDYAVAVNADNGKPGRALSVIRMVNVDPSTCAIPSTYLPSLNSETVEDDTSVSDNEIEPSTDTTFWGRIFHFGAPTKKTCIVGSSGEKQDELYSEEIDIIYDILDGVRVPAREGDRTENKLVRLNLTRADIERFVIACECNLNAAVARIIKSQTWRFNTFPIDQRLCRVELESGQFFHEGKDKQNNPIFCFRNSLSAPWAGNVRSTMLMILHRLEEFFNSRNGLVKITVIVLTGGSKEIDYAYEKPNKKKRVTTPYHEGGEQTDGMDAQASGTNQTTAEFHIHSNFQLVRQMYELLSFHYPERLNKALIVPSKAFSKRRISSFVLSPITQSRVVILNTQAELKKYVAESELKKLRLAA